MAWFTKKTADNNSNKHSRDTKASAKSKAKLQLDGHRYANIFPMMDGDAIEALARDIKENGLREKIVMFEGKILDGRCRQRACQQAGVKPKYKDYDGDDPLAFVVSKNLHRRHLNDSQRALAAGLASDLKRGANQHTEGLPIGRASKLFNVKERSGARGKEVVRHGVPEVVAAVAGGKLAISKAAKISRLPKSKQRKALASSAASPFKRGTKQKMAKSKASSKFGSSVVGAKGHASLTSLNPRKPKAYFDSIEKAWTDVGLAAAWANAPKEVRKRFINDVLS
jgi:ParB-like chromosome segregation protein Spo0J